MSSLLEMSVKLYDRYESLSEVKHYYGLLAIYALIRAAEAGEDAALLARCQRILRRFPAGVVHPVYNFASYTIGGNARAFLFFRGHDPEAEAMVREYAEELMQAPRDAQGILKNRYRPEADLIWIDVAMAATPYLLFAGLALDEPRYIDEAARQAFMHYDVFMDRSCGLLHQSKNFNGPGRFSEDHWSRGNGWGLIGLTELVQYLPTDSPHRAEACQRFVAHCEALLPHQADSGFWRQEIPLNSAWIESSGTGLILYGMGVGMRAGVLSRHTFGEPFRRGVDGLLSLAMDPDGTTYHSCPGCLCPGMGPEKGTVQAYLNLRPEVNEVHSFGPLMLALTEAHRLGHVAPMAASAPAAVQRAEPTTTATAVR